MVRRVHARPELHKGHQIIQALNYVLRIFQDSTEASPQAVSLEPVTCGAIRTSQVDPESTLYRPRWWGPQLSPLHPKPLNATQIGQKSATSLCLLAHGLCARQMPPACICDIDVLIIPSIPSTIRAPVRKCL